MINNSVFTSNHHLYGGAIFFQNNSNITISNTNFTENQAHFGGAIYLVSSLETQLDINITNSNFFGNQAITESNSHAVGGGIYFENVWRLFLIKNIFDGNQAKTKGCGLYFKGRLQSQLYSEANLFKSNSIFDTFPKATGGGAFIEDTDYIDNNNNYTGNHLKYV